MRASPLGWCLMGPVVTQVAVALGLDGVVRWVIGVIAALVVMSLVIVLIVVGSFATILSGGQPGSAPAAESPLVVRTLVASIRGPQGEVSPDIALANRIIELARAWLRVPYVFGGCSSPALTAAAWFRTCLRRLAFMYRELRSINSMRQFLSVILSPAALCSCQYVSVRYLPCWHLHWRRHADQRTNDRTGRQCGPGVHWILGNHYAGTRPVRT